MNLEFVQLSEPTSEPLVEVLRRELNAVRPKALGVASAFVTVSGLHQMMDIVHRIGSPKCRLLAGTSHAVTHPEALTQAIESGWIVRLAARPTTQGIFHPKLIIAGSAFHTDGTVRSPSFAYVGSSNITRGGLRLNVECGFLTRGTECPPGFSLGFARLWSSALPATKKLVQQYAEEFAARNRQRAVEDLDALGVSDAAEPEVRSYSALRQFSSRTSRPTMPPQVARGAWAGMESFTGEYRFQVEFPRAAGEVLRDLVGGKETAHSILAVHCTDDGQIRKMQYGYYADNAMFRLNIPNDVPGVARARKTRSGIALVEATKIKKARLQLTLVPPGDEADRVVRRSVALGTWGKTSTRLYGWY